LSGILRLWKKLAASRRYRHALVAAQIKRGLPLQIRILRDRRGWSQTDLAARAGVTQGVVSRAEDPNYGNLTLNTLLKLAAGFDVALQVRFVSFSEHARWFEAQDEDTLQVSSFEDDFPVLDQPFDVTAASSAAGQRLEPAAVERTTLPTSITTFDVTGVTVYQSAGAGPGVQYVH
jgi:transcriptional regulator with XRE-family HTH domain